MVFVVHFKAGMKRQFSFAGAAVGLSLGSHKHVCVVLSVAWLARGWRGLWCGRVCEHARVSPCGEAVGKRGLVAPRQVLQRARWLRSCLR